ncbi:MAG: hypothetical protein HC904_13840 [Blastochloris sp.]|nr:hypothetical protein [Blastochloris sp.]
MDQVWAFDLGISSIGEAIREGNKFKHVASWLIPAEFASTKEARTRRRMWRTRKAHQAREAWLRECCLKAGIEVLPVRRVIETKEGWQTLRADPRMEKEFPAIGETVCYNSSLLRIRLLRGEKLESWQIYKALHAAIQRRGYDPDIPWKIAVPVQMMKKKQAIRCDAVRSLKTSWKAWLPGKRNFHYPWLF